MGSGRRLASVREHLDHSLKRSWRKRFQPGQTGRRPAFDTVGKTKVYRCRHPRPRRQAFANTPFSGSLGLAFVVRQAGRCQLTCEAPDCATGVAIGRRMTKGTARRSD